MSEAWTEWQGQLIDGKFHLQKYLGGSGQTAVFQVEFHSEDGSAAAYSRDPRWRGSSSRPFVLKVIADPADPELQLSRWRLAQTLSHPHLLRILDTGRCRLGQIDLIFALMEHAEENLAQVIGERPLSADEARGMLEPILDALTWLHSQGLVHGHIEPANIMAANDVLKLSSDGIAPAEEAVPDEENAHSDETASSPANATPVLAAEGGRAPNSHDIYAAPETVNDSHLPASDIWSLGVALAEVLTQRLPRYPTKEPSESDEQPDPLLPEKLPAEFVEIVRGCLRRDLKLRWTIPAIRTRLNAPVPKPVARAEQPAFAQAATAGAAQARVATLVAQPAVRIPEPDQKTSQVKDSGAPAPRRADSNQRTAPERGRAPEPKKKASPDSSRPVAEPIGPHAFEVLLPIVRRFALPAIVVIAALGVIYAALGLLRREKPRATDTRQVIVKPEPTVDSGKGSQGRGGKAKERLSKKPSPASTQLHSSSAGQPAAPTSQASSSAQQPPGAPTVRSVSESGVRHIDDGAVEDGEPASVEGNASVSRSKSSPNASRNVKIEPADANVGVVQKVLPSASPSALHTIHGTVRVSVRVSVDRSGNVSRAEFASAGPSRYFARLSLNAAQGWKFSYGSGSPILLHFEFTRGGAKAFATKASS